MRRITVTVLSLLVGCAGGAMMHDYVVAPARAVPANVQKWAQFCTPYSGPGYIRAADVAEAINPDLKNRGLEGWELVSAVAFTSQGTASGALYCFRQPLQ